MTSSRWTVWDKTLGAVALVVVILVFSPFVLEVNRRGAWQSGWKELWSTIDGLQPTQRDDVDERIWECAHGWTITAFANICTYERVPVEEMHRLSDDLNHKLRDDVDLDTLQWLWNRLGETSPSGKNYIDNWDEVFILCFSQDDRS